MKKNAIAALLLILSFNVYAEEVHWQETGICVLTEERLYDELAEYPEDFKSKGYIKNGGMSYFLYDLVPVSPNSVNKLKLRGSLEHNEVLYFQIDLPSNKKSLVGTSITVKANQNKFSSNSDLFTKSSEFYNQFSEQFSAFKGQELVEKSVLKFDRTMRLQSLFPNQSSLLSLEDRILKAIVRNKHFYAKSQVVYNSKYVEIKQASIDEQLEKYSGTLLGASITCYFEEK